MIEEEAEEETRVTAGAKKNSVIYSSEMSADFRWTPRRYIPEDSALEDFLKYDMNYLPVLRIQL
jgi:hypothetical protein